MKLSTLQTIPGLIILIILATLTAAPAAAQSRELSILGSLIANDTAAAGEPADTAAFAALFRALGNVTDTAATASALPAVPSVAPLTFITDAFSSLPFYTSGTTALYEGTHTERLRAYLRSLGPVTSRYGWRESFRRVHHGVDIGMAVGDTVRAALSGTVTRVYFEPLGYGHLVVISHNGGLDTRYAHLQRPLVTPGQYVTAGTPIALSGNSGRSTGPHLHFEARLMNNPFNPLPD